MMIIMKNLKMKRNVISVDLFFKHFKGKLKISFIFIQFDDIYLYLFLFFEMIKHYTFFNIFFNL